MDTILILTTGGTIDKVYFDAQSSYEVGPPRIQALLDELNLAISYQVVSLMQKDSLDLTDADRKPMSDSRRLPFPRFKDPARLAGEIEVFKDFLGPSFAPPDGTD